MHTGVNLLAQSFLLFSLSLLFSCLSQSESDIHAPAPDLDVGCGPCKFQQITIVWASTPTQAFD